MTYVEVMIQAYTKANSITKEEAAQHFGATDLAKVGKNSTGQINSQNAQEILKDLRIDPNGVDAWARKTKE